MDHSANPMTEINEILRSLTDPRAGNEPVLAINQMEAQRAKNGGYPLHLYHAELDPVLALSRQQEQALAKRGYVRNYIPREFPKFLFRRNMDAKFEGAEFVEQREVKTRAAEDALLKAPAPAGCSQWAASPTLLDPLPEGPEEDPAITIARLEGKLAEARTAAEARGKK